MFIKETRTDRMQPGQTRPGKEASFNAFPQLRIHNLLAPDTLSHTVFGYRGNSPLVSAGDFPKSSVGTRVVRRTVSLVSGYREGVGWTCMATNRFRRRLAKSTGSARIVLSRRARIQFNFSFEMLFEKS